MIKNTDKQTFRSVFDARWAAFYDALKISYEYQTDALKLEDGNEYYPDFWLPEQKCWIVVRGEEVEDGLWRKVDLIHIYTKKPVYLFYGDVCVPGENDESARASKEFQLAGRRRTASFMEMIQEADKLGVLDINGLYDEDEFEKYPALQTCMNLDAPSHILAFFYDLLKFGGRIKIGHFYQKRKPYMVIPVDIDIVQFADLQNRLKIYSEEICELLSIVWRYEFEWELDDWYVDPMSRYQQYWCECPICHCYGIAQDGDSYDLSCKCLEMQGVVQEERYRRSKEYLTFATPSLIDAYKSAQQVKSCSICHEKLAIPDFDVCGKCRKEYWEEEQKVRAHVYRARRAHTPATLTLGQWIETLGRWQWLCSYCRTERYEVLEHFIPISKGGGTTQENCVPACLSCNSKKKDEHPERGVKQQENLL